MRVAIAYPPIISKKGVPLLSQNRQFQWFNRPTFIYPVVPACAATMAKKSGHEVLWLDGIAEQWTEAEFINQIKTFQPDLIMMEAKTPVITIIWKWIDQLKALLPRTLIAVVGDHVTALPEETLKESKADFVLTGGDYDFLLINLLASLNKKDKLEPGIWYREKHEIRNTGHFICDHDLKSLPWIDRDLTRWQLYSEMNGNYRRIPGTYIMSGRDCWHGKCTFCSWTTIYPNYRTRDPVDVVNEIGHLIEHYSIREIMDDTGTFPVGEWLNIFCQEMIKRGYNRKVTIDCNMRFGHLRHDDYNLMKKAGFRFVLFGLESANQSTLDRLIKGIKVEDITEGARSASSAGLDVHVTVMFGYPWESPTEMERTVELARSLLKYGYASTLQVTLVIPYPGTPLFNECSTNNMLATKDWDDFDMRMNVMQGKASENDIKNAIRRVYRGFFHPMAILNRILNTRHPIDDIKFYLRGFRSILGHLRDFS